MKTAPDAPGKVRRRSTWARRARSSFVLARLGEVLRESAPAELDPDRAASLRDATGMLFVVGLGLDAVWPGPGR